MRCPPSSHQLVPGPRRGRLASRQTSVESFWERVPVSSPRCDRILALASIAFALLLAPLLGALAQDASKPDATFKERYPAEQTPAQGAPDQAVSQLASETTVSRTAATKRERNVAT